MISQHFRKYSFLPLFFFIVLLSSRPAEACSCGERSTVLEAFTYADVVELKFPFPACKKAKRE